MTIVCIVGGLLLIYRGQQTIDDLYKFNGTVTSLTIQEFQNSNSELAYSLDFGFSETDKIYGIHLGTKDQAEKNNLKNEIEIGKTYTFYIDQTVLSRFDKHILGIHTIMDNEKNIYRNSPKVNSIGGSLFLIMGIGSLLILIYADKRKKYTL